MQEGYFRKQGEVKNQKVNKVITDGLRPIRMPSKEFFTLRRPRTSIFVT